MLSPDGRWRWDGTMWVPHATVPQRRAGLQARWIVLIAAGTLAVLLIAAAGIVMAVKLGTSLERTFGFHTTSGCMPSDFPAYPGAESAFAFTLGKVCSESYTTTDPPDAALSFYESHLSIAPWRLTRTRSTSFVYFGRDDSPEATGNVQAISDHGGAQITITYAP